MKFSMGQIVMGVILAVALTCLAVIGYTYATNPQARSQLTKQWSRSWSENDYLHVCDVAGKYTAPTGTFSETEYYLQLDCGMNDVQGTKRIAVNYFDGKASNAAVYKRVEVASRYLLQIKYTRYSGYVIAKISPTRLPVGHRFGD